jgi:non-canonical poly(A) RNA polymerase PAPD5/7
VQCGRKQIAVLLRALGNRLRSRGVARDVTLIPSARVPLLKYVDVASGLDVDISMGIMDGVLSANLMKKQSESFPAFRPLTLFLKAFMQARGLADVFKGGVSSYILQCMLLFHLQVQQMMHGSKAPANGANGALAASNGSMSNPCSNLGYLLFTFFELFGCTFSYAEHGIRIDDLRGGRLECYAKRGVAGRYDRERAYLLIVVVVQRLLLLVCICHRYGRGSIQRRH